LASLPLTGGGDPPEFPVGERWRFLAWLVLRLGWLNARGGRRFGTAAFEAALRAPAGARERLWRGYFDHPGWDEGSRAGGARREPTEVLLRRQGTLDHLRELNAGWRDWPALRTWLTVRMPRLARADEGEEAPRVLDYLVMGPLRWLGLVESSAANQAIRLTVMGLELLRERPPAYPHDARAVEIEPSGRIALRSEQGVGSLHPLLPFLHRRGAVEWALSRESFLDGLQRGREVTEALASLRGVGARDDWAATLWEWEREARAGRLVDAVMLDLTEHPAAGHVLADSRVAPYLLGALGPALAIVRPEGVQPLAAGLRDLGVLVERLPGGAGSRKHPGALLSESDLALALALAERDGAGSTDLAAKLRPLVGDKALESARAHLRARKGRHGRSKVAR
jgi:hypothetical protein